MEDLALKSLLSKVAEVLTAGKEGEALSNEDNYIAWCSPGLSFQKESLQFAQKLMGENGDQVRKSTQDAFEFARVVNSIPSLNAINTFEQKGSMVWDIYEQVLNQSKVPNTNLTEEEETKIKDLRKKITVEKEISTYDSEGNEIAKLVVVDTPFTTHYKSYKKAYQNALRAYNSKRINAMYSDKSEVVLDFSLNGASYQDDVDQAMDDWVSNGCKNEYEQIVALIDNLGRKSMDKYKQDLHKTLEKAKLNNVNGDSFYLTTFYPSNFMDIEEGWTHMFFDSKSLEKGLKETHQSVSGSTGIKIGLWSFGASGGYDKATEEGYVEGNDLKVEFEINQVILGRPWFNPDFLISGSWGWSVPGKNLLSDGASTPKGLMPAYATTAVFIKDIKITSASLMNKFKATEEKIKGGGSFGWGPFSIGANYSKDNKQEQSNYETNGNTIEIKGMQLIALKCATLPICPNPNCEF